MTTQQIYGLVNSVAAQSTGHSGIVATDANTLVSLGNVVLSSSTYTEDFLNTLVMRIGRTIMDFRTYRNKLADMVLSDFEYGKVMQKIKVKMPESIADPSYGLTDGVAVDPWIVHKPDVIQKLFTNRTPYMFAQTISRQNLKEAFLSAENMDAFISSVMGEMRNAYELSLENLGFTAMANFIAEAKGNANQNIALVTEYNGLGGSVTASTALLDKDFLAYAIRRINETFDNMQYLTENYNDGSVARFTPMEDIRVKLLSSFVRAAETVVQYAAFHEELIRVDNSFLKIPYWQAADNPGSISVKRASDDAATTESNIIAVIHDRDALGVYQIEEESNTTSLNPAGRYYTNYLHCHSLWLNDLSQNFVYFSLN